MKINIRKATTKDVAQIMDIYNWAVESTTGTFDTEEKTYENRVAWLSNREPQFSVYVAEYEKDTTLPGVTITNRYEIAGYIALNKWSDRSAYNITPEVSLYIQPEYHGQGIGSKLLQVVIDEARSSKKIKSIIARVTAENNASVALHRKFDFTEVGTIKMAGIKFERFLDVIIFQYLLD